MKYRISSLFLAILTIVGGVAAQSPEGLETDILRLLETIGQSGTYSGNYDEESSDRANRQLMERLLSDGRQLAVLRYGFPRLKEEMYVATSSDGKLRIYSWDKQTGGTMRDFASVFQYQGKSGSVFTWADDDIGDAAGVFYQAIYQVSSRSGPIYLAASTFIGSTSLHGHSIKVVRIIGDKLDQKANLIRTPSGLKNSVGFAYDFFTVVDRPERPINLFEFDAARRTFRFPVVIEDNKTPQGRVTGKYITYRFDGKYFVRAN
jgi:hypothetical protein